MLLPLLTLLALVGIEFALALRRFGSTLGAARRRRRRAHPDQEHLPRSSGLILLEPDAVYLLAQGIVFLMLGALIHRLMVFTVPLLAVMISGSPIILSAVTTRIFQLSHAPQPQQPQQAPGGRADGAADGAGALVVGRRALERKSSPPKSTSAKKRAHADDRPLLRRLSFDIEMNVPHARSFLLRENSPGVWVQNVVYVTFTVFVLLLSRKNISGSLFQQRQQEVNAIEKVRGPEPTARVDRRRVRPLHGR